MKVCKITLFKLIITFPLLFLIHCTENPFGGDAEISSKRTLTGRVNLRNTNSSAGLYVWLEGVNSSTFSDPNGRFQINLPPPSSQPGGGFTGSANLYFYMANFEMETGKVVLRNGEFLYSQGNINEKGEFREPRNIRKILNFHTALSPSIIDTTYVGTIRATITIEVLVPRVDFITLRSDSQYFTITAAEKINTPEYFGRTLTSSGVIRLDTTLFQGRHTFTADYFISRAYLPVGDYIFKPYMWIKQEDLPRALIRSLDAPYERYNQQYANLPFQREGGRFRVR
jgi:hypothetical protein